MYSLRPTFRIVPAPKKTQHHSVAVQAAWYAGQLATATRQIGYLSPGQHTPTAYPDGVRPSMLWVLAYHDYRQGVGGIQIPVDMVTFCEDHNLIHSRGRHGDKTDIPIYCIKLDELLQLTEQADAFEHRMLPPRDYPWHRPES